VIKKFNLSGGGKGDMTKKRKNIKKTDTKKIDFKPPSIILAFSNGQVGTPTQLRAAELIPRI